jgi:hypothetical protein
LIIVTGLSSGFAVTGRQQVCQEDGHRHRGRPGSGVGMDMTGAPQSRLWPDMVAAFASLAAQGPAAGHFEESARLTMLSPDSEGTPPL